MGLLAVIVRLDDNLYVEATSVTALKRHEAATIGSIKAGEVDVYLRDNTTFILPSMSIEEFRELGGRIAAAQSEK